MGTIVLFADLYERGQHRKSAAYEEKAVAYAAALCWNEYLPLSMSEPSETAP